MNNKIYIFLICCFCSISSLFGQLNSLKFENLDTVDGLSSSTCLEVFQDKEGFLWFGTIDGLNRYNGYEFKVYRSILNDPNSISNNRINAIEEDDEGNLWIGTNNGLNLYNKETDKFTHINLNKQYALSDNPQKIINDLLFDSLNNNLWVATNNGVIKIELEDVSIKNYTFSYYRNMESNLNSLDDNNVNVILLDNDNTIWVGTNGVHLNHYNAEKDNFDRVYINTNEDYELNHISKNVFIDSDGDFWIGNNLSDLILWNKKQNSFSHISLAEGDFSIFDFYQDKSGLFWVSTDVTGLFLFEKGDTKYKQHIVNNFSDPFSLPNNKPSKIFEDNNGVFWIGSHDIGVSKLDPYKYSFGHHYYQRDNDKGLSEKTIQSVLQDSKERIWISAYNGGLNLFNEEENTFKHFSHNPKNFNSLSSNKIMYTFQSQDGNIWVCTLDGGVNKFNPETNRFERFLHDDNNSSTIGQSSVWSGVEDSKNRLWFGLRSEGLSLYNPKTKRFTNYKNEFIGKNSLVSNNVLCTYVDSKNRLLIGTSLGLNIVDLNKLEAFIPKDINFVEVEGLKGNGINYVTEDHLGNIWVGADSGLYKLNKSLDLIRLYTSLDGLPNNLVVGITEDENNYLWITTKGGLSQLNPNTDQFKNFNVHDGIQGPEYQSKSIAKTKDGRIIIGGINGFNIFHPNDISTPVIPKLKPIITSLKLNNKLVKVGDSINGRIPLQKPITDAQNIELKYNENYISFEFVALYFENPEQIEYAYRMKGIDDEFIEIGSQRTVSHSNLTPGDYTFEVKASIDNQWDNIETASIHITVLPPLWKTWWAYTLYFIAGGGLFWVVMRLYTSKVQEEQLHELDQMKLQFFVNVSHEFRTPLTLILNPVDKILSNFNGDPKTVEKSALTIQRSARRLLHLVNQLLDYRKMDAGMAPLQLEKGDLVKFCSDIFDLFRGLATKKEITYKFESSINEVNALFDFDKVEKIITNLISNAIKFTESEGEITVSIDKISNSKIKSYYYFFKRGELKKYVQLTVKDSGVGLSKEQLKNIFTRFYNVDVKKAGTGIGLNFTKSLVESHGGDIFVESQLGKGSKFTVRLPLDIKSEPDIVENVKNEFLINSMKSVEYEMSIANSDIAVESVNQKTGESKKKQTILLVEDNKELRTHLKGDLSEDYETLEAVDGEEGLKMVQKHFPDIVISDVMMPRMDGFEMCKAIKSEFETCHIPVLLLTARSFEDDRVNAYNSGADGYLAKPFVMSVLKARIRNLLDAKSRLRQRFSEIGGVFESSEVTSNNIDEVFLDKATKIIIENISDIDFKQEHLLKELGIGRSQFYRKINSLTGNNPSYFIRTIRLRYAADLLKNHNYSIKEVTHMAGFNSTAYFSKTFRELFDITPSEFIKKLK